MVSDAGFAMLSDLFILTGARKFDFFFLTLATKIKLFVNFIIFFFCFLIDLYVNIFEKKT